MALEYTVFIDKQQIVTQISSTKKSHSFNPKLNSFYIGKCVTLTLPH